MPAGKIVDEQEVLQWIAEGKTYEWIQDTYLSKYGIETTPSMWSNFRRRRGVNRRIVRDDELIPWAVDERHRWAYPVQMLRLEARHRAGLPFRDADVARHRNFMARLRDNKLVIAYTPEHGFYEVPRQPADTDVVRRPALAHATHRRRAD